MTDAVDIGEEKIFAPSENETDSEPFRNVFGDQVIRHSTLRKSSSVSTSILSTGRAADQTSDAMPESLRMNWSKLAASDIGNQLYDRIFLFANREDGWRGPGSKRLSANSLSTFLDFWTHIKDNAKQPSLALTSEGGLNAQWNKSDREFIDLTFQPDLKVYFGLFQKAKIYEGVDSFEKVLRLMELLDGNPLEWKEK